MKPSEHKLVSTLVLACAVGLLAGCGHQASSITAPGVGKVAGAPVNTSEGPFGGQTVAWYEAQLNNYPKPEIVADPAFQEALWCSGKDAQGNATVSTDAVAKRRGTVSCQNLFRGASLAQGPYAGHGHAWFKAHPQQRGIESGWCRATGNTRGACFAVETTGAGFY